MSVLKLQAMPQRTVSGRAMVISFTSSGSSCCGKQQAPAK